MAHYIYYVCKKCARVVRTQKVTGTDEDTVEGKTYLKASSKECGCTSKKKQLDIAKII